MCATYHFKSAADINSDLLEAIKATFNEKSVVITVEEELDETAFLSANQVNKEMLLKSIAQDKNGETIPIRVSQSPS